MMDAAMADRFDDIVFATIELVKKTLSLQLYLNAAQQVSCMLVILVWLHLHSADLSACLDHLKDRVVKCPR